MVFNPEMEARQLMEKALDLHFLPKPSPLGEFMGQAHDREIYEQEEANARQDRLEAEARDGEDAIGPGYKLMTIRDVQALPDPEWVIDTILPDASFTTLTGQPGTKKSFTALDMACSIASMEPWHGYKITKPGAVIYGMGEGLRAFKYRIEAWELAHPNADLEMLHRNLHILPVAVQLLDRSQAATLINTAREINLHVPLRLVIIDTLSRSIVGGDENSSETMGKAVAVLSLLREKTNASTLLVHHTDKAGKSERGSGALRGASDTSMIMREDAGSGVITLTNEKMKDAVEFPDMDFTIAPYGHSIVLKHDTQPKLQSIWQPKFKGGDPFSGGAVQENPFG